MPNKSPFYIAIVPINSLGEVLIGKRREDGIWTTIAGGALENETPEEAAVREAWEEANLLVDKQGLELIATKKTPNDKTIHCFLYRTNQKTTNTSMDPDKEVSNWIWCNKESIPQEMTRKNNQNRLETINQAFMKFHGLTKSIDFKRMNKASEVFKNEGREGLLRYINNIRPDAPETASKIYVKYFPKEGQQDTELGQNPTPVLEKSKWLEVGTKVEMEHTKDKNKAKKIAQDHLNEDPDYYKDWQNKEKILFQEKAPKLEKGGEGSGKRGHTTNKDNVISLNRKLKKPQDEGTTKLFQHLDSLESGAVIEGAKTKSGKPVVLRMDQATAHGYTPEDHTDAMNLHYDLMDKWRTGVDKYKQLGHKIPKEAEKIANFHEKKFKQHFKESQRLKDRMKETQNVKKSVTQMGHHEAGDLDTADYAISASTSRDSVWLERLYKLMDGFEYGDTPRELPVDKGVISLVKVDDGQYTGYFRTIKNVEDGILEDNAKIRIERITIPDLLQLMMAKEWINPLNEVKNEHPQELYNALNDKLSDEPIELELPEVSPIDKKIQLLELVNKLLT